MKWQNFDTTVISQTPEPGNTYHIFAGLNPKGEKIVIFDTNQDRDFSNDEIHRFDTSYFDNYKVKLPPLPQLVLQKPEGPLSLQFTPYQSHFTPESYKSRLEQLLEISIIGNMNWVGTLNAEGTNHNIKLMDESNSLHPRSYSQRMRLQFDSDSSTKYTYSQNENIRLGNGLYKWENFAKPSDPVPTISFRKIRDIPSFNPLPGSFVPPVAAIDFMTGNKIHMVRNKGNYTILDFWEPGAGPVCNLFLKWLNITRK